MSGVYEAIVGKPESITIVLKSAHSKIRRKMFCINCGGYLFTSYKQVAVIIQGVAAESEVVQEIFCPKCKVVYEIC